MTSPEDHADEQPVHGWEVEPQESGFVAFWPHEEALTAAEFSTAVAAWVGGEVSIDAIETDDDAIWAFGVQMPGIDSGLVVWCERSRDLSERDQTQIGDGASQSPWVIRLQTILSSDEPAEEYFMCVGLLGGAMPDVVAILDVVTGEVYPRARIDRDFLTEDAAPVERLLWRLGRYEALPDGDCAFVLLGTCGLSRCGIPELELIEVPREHSESGAVLLHTLAGLLLENEMPDPGETLEIGDDLVVRFQKVGDVTPCVTASAAGSEPWRVQAREHGLSEFALPRAVICAEKALGNFRSLWVWPREVVERIEAGKAVLYMTQHSVRSTERRARSTWGLFATAFASLMRTGNPDFQELARTGFTVQAPVPDTAGDRIEQSWFRVQKIDHDAVTVAVVDQPITRQDVAPGFQFTMPTSNVTDWRVEIGDEMFDPDDADSLMLAIDRVRNVDAVPPAREENS
ncbi:MAG: hypothetical protein EXS17_06060 [Phycisphaerales bacterium]|nr:hypothetical protein [Phycisphaerales bacterium]